MLPGGLVKPAGHWLHWVCTINTQGGASSSANAMCESMTHQCGQVTSITSQRRQTARAHMRTDPDTALNQPAGHCWHVSPVLLNDPAGHSAQLHKQFATTPT